MKLIELKRFFTTSLVNYYEKEEIESVFYIILEDIYHFTKTDYVIKSEFDFDLDFALMLEIIDKLKQYKPVQYITGYSIFCKRKFKVNPQTLIPRPETEELTHKVINQYQNDNRKLRILDIGTGSGCIAISLALELKNSDVTAVDINAGALKIAGENAKLHNANVEFKQVDILNSDHEEFGSLDIIISNPPYITHSEKQYVGNNVLKYEPYTALFVPDTDPLLFYRRIKEVADNSLKKCGKVFLELNPNYAHLVKELYKDFNFVALEKDLFGKERFLIAEK